MLREEPMQTHWGITMHGLVQESELHTGTLGGMMGGTALLENSLSSPDSCHWKEESKLYGEPGSDKFNPIQGTR